MKTKNAHTKKAYNIELKILDFELDILIAALQEYEQSTIFKYKKESAANMLELLKYQKKKGPIM